MFSGLKVYIRGVEVRGVYVPKIRRKRQVHEDARAAGSGGREAVSLRGSDEVVRSWYAMCMGLAHSPGWLATDSTSRG